MSLNTWTALRRDVGGVFMTEGQGPDILYVLTVGNCNGIQVPRIFETKDEQVVFYYRLTLFDVNTRKFVGKTHKSPKVLPTRSEFGGNFYNTGNFKETNDNTNTGGNQGQNPTGPNQQGTIPYNVNFDICPTLVISKGFPGSIWFVVELCACAVKRGLQVGDRTIEAGAIVREVGAGWVMICPASTTVQNMDITSHYLSCSSNVRDIRGSGLPDQGQENPVGTQHLSMLRTPVMAASPVILLSPDERPGNVRPVNSQLIQSASVYINVCRDGGIVQSSPLKFLIPRGFPFDSTTVVPGLQRDRVLFTLGKLKSEIQTSTMSTLYDRGPHRERLSVSTLKDSDTRPLPFLKVVGAETVGSKVAVRLSSVVLAFEGAVMRNPGASLMALQTTILKHVTKAVPSSILSGRMGGLAHGISVMTDASMLMVENARVPDSVVSSMVLTAFVHNGLRPVTTTKTLRLSPVPFGSSVCWKPVNTGGAGEADGSLMFPTVPVDDGVVLCLEVVVMLTKVTPQGQAPIQQPGRDTCISLGTLVVPLEAEGSTEKMERARISTKTNCFPSLIPALFAPELNPVLSTTVDFLPCSSTRGAAKPDVFDNNSALGPPRGKSSSLERSHPAASLPQNPKTNEEEGSNHQQQGIHGSGGDSEGSQGSYYKATFESSDNDGPVRLKPRSVSSKPDVSRLPLLTKQENKPARVQASNTNESLSSDSGVFENSLDSDRQQQQQPEKKEEKEEPPRKVDDTKDEGTAYGRQQPAPTVRAAEPTRSERPPMSDAMSPTQPSLSPPSPFPAGPPARAPPLAADTPTIDKPQSLTFPPTQSGESTGDQSGVLGTFKATHLRECVKQRAKAYNTIRLTVYTEPVFRSVERPAFLRLRFVVMNVQSFLASGRGLVEQRRTTRETILERQRRERSLNGAVCEAFIDLSSVASFPVSTDIHLPLAPAVERALLSSKQVSADVVSHLPRGVSLCVQLEMCDLPPSKRVGWSGGESPSLSAFHTVAQASELVHVDSARGLYQVALVESSSETLGDILGVSCFEPGTTRSFPDATTLTRIRIGADLCLRQYDGTHTEGLYELESDASGGRKGEPMAEGSEISSDIGTDGISENDELELELEAETQVVEMGDGGGRGRNIVRQNTADTEHSNDASHNEDGGQESREETHQDLPQQDPAPAPGAGAAELSYQQLETVIRTVSVRRTEKQLLKVVGTETSLAVMAQQDDVLRVTQQLVVHVVVYAQQGDFLWIPTPLLEQMKSSGISVKEFLVDEYTRVKGRGKAVASAPSSSSSAAVSVHSTASHSNPQQSQFFPGIPIGRQHVTQLTDEASGLKLCVIPLTLSRAMIDVPGEVVRIAAFAAPVCVRSSRPNTNSGVSAADAGAGAGASPFGPTASQMAEMLLRRAPRCVTVDVAVPNFVPLATHQIIVPLIKEGHQHQAADLNDVSIGVGLSEGSEGETTSCAIPHLFSPFLICPSRSGLFAMKGIVSGTGDDRLETASVLLPVVAVCDYIAVCPLAGISVLVSEVAGIHNCIDCEEGQPHSAALLVLKISAIRGNIFGRPRPNSIKKVPIYILRCGDGLGGVGDSADVFGLGQSGERFPVVLRVDINLLYLPPVTASPRYMELAFDIPYMKEVSNTRRYSVAPLVVGKEIFVWKRSSSGKYVLCVSPLVPGVYIIPIKISTSPNAEQGKRRLAGDGCDRPAHRTHNRDNDVDVDNEAAANSKYTLRYLKLVATIPLEALGPNGGVLQSIIIPVATRHKAIPPRSVTLGLENTKFGSEFISVLSSNLDAVDVTESQTVACDGVAGISVKATINFAVGAPSGTRECVYVYLVGNDSGVVEIFEIVIEYKTEREMEALVT